MTTITLPHGYTIRAPRMEEAGVIADLMACCERLEYYPPEDYIPDYTVDDLRAEWQELDMEKDAWVVLSPEQEIVGYMNVYTYGDNRAFISANSCVHPQHCGRGLSTALLELAEERARQLLQEVQEQPHLLMNWVSVSNSAACTLLEQRGFVLRESTIYRMEITMSELPQEPVWPEGIAVRSFLPGRDDVIVRETLEEAFGTPVHDWEQLYTLRKNFDPTFWHVACAGEHIIGVLVSLPVPGMGWIQYVGVLPAWRGRGLAKALLLHTFQNFYQRGITHVALSVNTRNATAHTLYEKVGMHASCQITSYQKML